MDSYTSRVEVVESAKQLLQNKFGIDINSNSLLGRSFAEVHAELDKHLDPSIINPMEEAMNFQKGMRETAGVVRMCQRLLFADEQGILTEAFKPHLELLSNSLVSQASRYIDHGVDENQLQRQNSDKVFELTVALAAAQIGKDIQLEHPANSHPSNNPDILVTIGGIRWGFACKVIGGKNIESWFRLIQIGIAQINNSPAERGCVVVSLRNWFEHNALNPQLDEEGTGEWHCRAFTDEQVDKQVEEEFALFNRKLGERSATDEGGNSFRALFSQPKTVYGFLGYLETTAVVVKPHGLMCAPKGYCWYFYPTKIECPIPYEVRLLQKALCRPNASPAT